VRVPRSLHRKLSEEARREGVSLNQFVTVALAETVGIRQAQASTRP
jgi:predicted HicB family RNase H-like nuclease